MASRPPRFSSLFTESRIHEWPNKHSFKFTRIYRRSNGVNAVPCYLPPLNYCDDHQPALSYYHQPPSAVFSSKHPRSSNQPGTPRREEPQNPEESTIEFTPSKFSYLQRDERFILEARLRKKTWKAIRESYMKEFPNLATPKHNTLSMKVCRLKKKYPEVRHILNERIPTRKTGRPVTRNKRMRARLSRAGDDRPAGRKRNRGVQQLSYEDAIEAGQTVLDFLGQPGNDNLTLLSDCMALLRIVGLLDRIKQEQ
ncbi:reverse transcriptase and rnase h [Colletotrichum incanum]|uniref:Reverse transcriptase and rnase h n=1 Tax=Colletotrichum incanum TaxID=1573173 RepID=A0A162NXK0_COLIC|nr:reverse transcriptase and rnase h [Colletotrichum incanum]